MRFWLSLGVFALAVFLLILLVLNYLNVLPLSEQYPQIFGWLPKQMIGPSPSATQVPSPQPVANTHPQFVPSLDPTSQRGALIKKVTVLYTLGGKITANTPAGDTYDLTLVSSDGSQTYELKGVGGENVLRGKGRNSLAWSDVKVGDDALVDVSISGNLDSPEGAKIFVSQIVITNR